MKIGDVLMHKYEIEINIFGALIVFIVFSFGSFLDWMVDKSEFILPFWGWGLLGVVLFEIIYFVAKIKKII